MSQLEGPSTLKRKRPDSSPISHSLLGPERALYEVIRSKANMGIWTRDMKREINLPDSVFNKSLKTLQTKKLVKEVVNIKNKGKKHYMAVEFEPSSEITGGAWYVDGNLDREFIQVLRQQCCKHIHKRRIATVEMVWEDIIQSQVCNTDCTVQQIMEIVKALVLDNEIMEVKSDGSVEYDSIPRGAVCYKCMSKGGHGKGSKIGVMASIPCGVCPHISICTPDGVINPNDCLYFTKWLEF